MEIFTEVYTKMAFPTVTDSIIGKMAQHIKEIFLQDFVKEKVYGLILKATIMKASLKMIKKMVLECFYGRMVTNMKEIL